MKRSAGLDLVRVVGVVAIVAGHSLRGWTYPWLFTWHVPVFFVLSGYLWHDQRTWREELHRRANSLLLPYATWLVFNCLVWFGVLAIQGQAAPRDAWWRVLAGGAYLGYPPNAFWFVTSLFVAALVMRAAWNVRPALAWLVGLAGVTWATLAPNQVRAVPEAAGIALAGVGFMCLGLGLRQASEWLRHALPTALATCLAGLAGLAGLLAGGFGLVRNVDMKQGELGTPVASFLVAAVISAGLIVVCQSLEGLFPAWLARMISRLAQAALPVVLTHCLVLWCFFRVGQPTDSGLALSLALVIPFGLGLALTTLPGPARRLFV
ncbi:MAG: acyltransferase family protein [Bifidobacteriaceae bacterium]|nr:acyltransferase family protein [Bifidobacteriaceae bacterium]